MLAVGGYGVREDDEEGGEGGEEEDPVICLSEPILSASPNLKGWDGVGWGNSPAGIYSHARCFVRR